MHAGTGFSPIGTLNRISQYWKWMYGWMQWGLLGEKMCTICFENDRQSVITSVLGFRYSQHWGYVYSNVLLHYRLEWEGLAYWFTFVANSYYNQAAALKEQIFTISRNQHIAKQQSYTSLKVTDIAKHTHITQWSRGNGTFLLAQAGNCLVECACWCDEVIPVGQNHESRRVQSYNGDPQLSLEFWK